MTLQLLPGIVWALDEPDLALVRRWWDSLPPKAQNVFTVAGSWEELTEIITTYREQRFDETILRSGLSLEPQEQGRRVNVVVVGSFSEGRITWAEVEEKLQSLGAFLSLEHHRVLLHHTLPSIGRPPVQRDVDFSQLSTLRTLPWLLTRVVTGGFTLGDEEFFQYFSQLLDVLFLAERVGRQDSAYLVNYFFQLQPQPYCVCLAGFPRLSLEKLLKEIAASLAQAILHRAYNRHYEDMRPAIQAFERRLAKLGGEFLRGDRTATQVEDHLFSPHGLPLLSVAAILREVPDILERQAIHLRGEGTINSTPPSWWTNLWQKILACLGRDQPTVRNVPDQVQKDYLVNRFTRIIQVIKEMTIQAKEMQEKLDLPDHFIRVWSDELNDLVKRGIQEEWKGIELKNRLAIKIVRDVQDNFSNAISHWNLQGDRVREMARALEEGNLLRFSASLKGGLPVFPQAVVTSFNLGQQIRHGTNNVPSATLSFYSGRPPLIVAASQPVPIKNISF